MIGPIYGAMAADPSTIDRLEVQPATGGGEWIVRIGALFIFLAILFVVAPGMEPLAGTRTLPPLLLVVAGTAALGLMSFTRAQWTTTLRCLFRPSSRRSCGDRRLAAGIFRMMAAYCIGAGAIGTIMGLIQLLGGMDNPETLGAGIAVALLSSLYAAVLAILLMVAGTVASSSNDWTVTIASRTVRPVGVAASAAAAAVGVALLCVMVLLWSLKTPI